MGLAGGFSMLFAFLFLGERPRAKSIVGALLALAGVVLVGWSALRSAGADSQRVSGDLLFVLSAAVWAVYTVIGKRVSHRVPAITGILLASALGVALLAPVALWREGVPDFASWSTAAIVNVVYLGLGATAVAFVTYHLTVKLIGIDRTAPGLGLVPFFGVVGAALILGERLTWLHGAGGVLVILGIAFPALRLRGA